ncbi:hypothetical protein HU200_028538 [Digitaria exilis]|uniref:Uncharacterized protein n=1 Tax=Digitaria exilis TaxID=1010633 RepID=A0A835ESL5_9POAL|nr:hypothetical protein HU200_028538 [Digitaria exilis]CAB3482007.1 unnamed protein product [Digitaria exilis]
MDPRRTLPSQPIGSSSLTASAELDLDSFHELYKQDKAFVVCLLCFFPITKSLVASITVEAIPPAMEMQHLDDYPPGKARSSSL